jgi:nitrogen fixation protein NifU and related proteins
MTSYSRELYQELIIEHGRHPRNFGKKFDATDSLEGFNPLCGDKITLFLKYENDCITDLAFEGSGCAISMASASLMTEALKGKTKAEAIDAFENFHHMLTDNDAPPQSLGKLTALVGVRDYPMRVKCATLSWHTLKSLLNGYHDPVTTE